MPRKRHTPEQIIAKLRDAEVGLASGHNPISDSKNGSANSACSGRLLIVRARHFGDRQGRSARLHRGELLA